MGSGSRRDYDSPSLPRTYLAPSAQAPVVIRRALILDGLKRLRAERALGRPTVAITIADVADGDGLGGHDLHAATR
jgi:hypothetical protein